MGRSVIEKTVVKRGGVSRDLVKNQKAAPSFLGKNMTGEVIYLDPELCPVIPANVSFDEFLRYFDISEFRDIYTIDATIDTISIVLTKGEEGLNVVKIPTRLISPDINSIKFPRFILNASKFSQFQIDYNQRALIFNQNELLYLILHHRLRQYSGYKNHYAYLLTKDIQNLLNYSDYNLYNSYNAIQKANHSFAILDVFKKEFGNSFSGNPLYPDSEESDIKISVPIGENILHPKFTSQNLGYLFRDFPILPASESMASETGKFVISDEEIYKCAGFKLDQVKKEIRTIFGIKPNLPARFKSHVVSDAFKADKFDLPIFAEDIIPDYEYGTDKTILNAVCIFSPIQEDGKFLCGEIEASHRFCNNEVIKREIIKEQFAILLVNEGEVLTRIDGRYIIGMDENNEEVYLYGFDSVKIISCERMGIAGSWKIVAECVKKIGSSRIISSTGVKGVTKPRHDLGVISVKNAVGDLVHLPVDLVIGSNSIKAKENTIFLAQAALAHQLHFSPEGQKFISSLNEEEINRLKAQVQEIEYLDADGNTSKVVAGIVPIKVTEMAYMYKNAKFQSFMMQSAWHLHQNGYKNLAEHIYKTSVPPKDISIVEELSKIIYDNCGKFINDDSLPVYDLYDVQKHFDVNDCRVDTNPTIEHQSRLLDREINKGFYIYLPHRDEYVRMPSANLILRFVSKIADGTFIYPRLLTVTSQIVRACITKNPDTGRIDLGFIMRKNDDRFAKNISLVNKYINLCVGMLHYRNNYLSSLMTPKVFGCSMKQMTDVNVPIGVCIILDRHLYERLGSHTDGYLEKNNEFYALLIRNPVLWKAQIQSVKVWDYEMFKAYLSLNTKANPEEYLNERYCKDLILLNPEDAIIQQSDVDGDLMPMFVPEGIEAQKILSQFKPIHESIFTGVNGITQDEIEWIMQYRESEFEGNSIFQNLNKPYKLYTISLKSGAMSEKSFSKYFANSIIAKGDVGIGTSNLWALHCLLDVFKKLVNENRLIDTKGKKLEFSDEQYHLISYAYSRLLQDFVIRGIKWNESGSSEFKPFLLENMIQKQYRTQTYNFFLNNIKLDKGAVEKLFEILAWGDSLGYITQIASFISFYNSGNINRYVVTPEFEEILLDTFYGSRLKKFFNIKNQILEAQQSGFKYELSGASVDDDAPLSGLKNIKRIAIRKPVKPTTGVT